MDHRSVFFAYSTLELLPIFALIYVFNEFPSFSPMDPSSSKLINIAAIIASFFLPFLHHFVNGYSTDVLLSLVIIITLSLATYSTYYDYTVDEGFYITIPYFILYLCSIFSLSRTGIEMKTSSWTPIILVIISFGLILCDCLFWLSLYLGWSLQHTLWNYLSFLALILSTWNLLSLLTIDLSKRSSLVIIEVLLFQMIHIYLSLTHLLSVKFELIDDKTRMIP